MLSSLQLRLNTRGSIGLQAFSKSFNTSALLAEGLVSYPPRGLYFFLEIIAQRLLSIDLVNAQQMLVT